VFANNWSTSGNITDQWGSSSLQFSTTYNLNGGYGTCCQAFYAGIGSIGTDWVTDLYNTGGSNLPMQLKDVAAMKGAWTIQVPPVKSTDIYRVYIEIFLSSTTDGVRNSGNITIDFYTPMYTYPNDNPVNLLGTTLTMADYGTNPNGQGPFLAFRFPAGTYNPDSNGVITIPSIDVGAVLAWCQTYKNYYPGTVYLTEVNLAEEVSNVAGKFTTTFASFEVQKTGQSMVYLPAWSSTYWKGGGSSSGSLSSGGSSSGASSDSGSSSGGLSSSGGSPSDGSSGSGPSSGGSSSDGGSSSGGSSGSGPSSGGSSSGGGSLSGGSSGSGPSSGGPSSDGGSSGGSSGSGPTSGGSATGNSSSDGAGFESSNSSSGCSAAGGGDFLGFVVGALALAMARIRRSRRVAERE
jgi:hypothetical protein